MLPQALFFCLYDHQSVQKMLIPVAWQKKQQQMLQVIEAFLLKVTKLQKIKQEKQEQLH
jgi:hypothetical protein